MESLPLPLSLYISFSISHILSSLPYSPYEGSFHSLHFSFRSLYLSPFLLIVYFSLWGLPLFPPSLSFSSTGILFSFSFSTCFLSLSTNICCCLYFTSSSFLNTLCLSLFPCSPCFFVSILSQSATGSLSASLLCLDYFFLFPSIFPLIVVFALSHLFFPSIYSMALYDYYVYSMHASFNPVFISPSVCFFFPLLLSFPICSAIFAMT